MVVDDVSFEVRGGEVLVVAGVQGNGQTELTEALLGLEGDASGSIRLDGKELVGRSVRRHPRRAASASCPRTARTTA